jgi:hypothetical protein
MTPAPAPVSVFRLRFIDMARAVAILLMLEGHFIDALLAPEWRAAGHPIYEVWLHCRGLAAPMFFTVTGLIFAYLLGGVRDEAFFRSRRVRRGLLRALELMFCGYLLQVNLRQVPDWIHSGPGSWLHAFHVLQCIAVGLLVMTAVFGIFRGMGPRGLIAVFMAIGFMDFLLAVTLANQSGPIPSEAPGWIQNAIKGRWANFPLAPWLAFTFYGAAIGVWVRYLNESRPGALGPLAFLVAGAVLSQIGWSFDRFLGARWLDLTGHEAGPRVLPDLVHGRIGEILLIFGVLVWMEKRIRPGASWFQTIGRNTFPIYVGHVILLYGGLFGFGLNIWIGRTLNPWQAGIGALLFCGFFAVFAQFVEPIALRWKTWLGTVMRQRP